MKAMAAQALVLDFGGVVTKTLFETHALTEAALGLASGMLTWRGPFQPETDPLWQAMQRDEMPERDYGLARSCEIGRLVGEDWQQIETFVRRSRGDDQIRRPPHGSLRHPQSATILCRSASPLRS
jgi:putative hydrolase of the HAD superfamily